MPGMSLLLYLTSKKIVCERDTYTERKRQIDRDAHFITHLKLKPENITIRNSMSIQFIINNVL